MAQLGTHGCWRWRGLAVAARLAPWLIAASAQAQQPSVPPPSPATLAWVRTDGAEACPDARAMRAAIANRLGRDPFAGEAGPLIEASASRDGAGWRAKIRALDGGGELLGSRELTSPAASCESLAAAAALAIALVIDPEAVERAAEARPASAAPSPAPAKAGEPNAGKPSPNAQPGPLAWVDLRALGSAGLLPGFAPGVALSADATLTRWLTLSGGLSYWPEQKTDARRGAIAIGLTAASAAACAEPVPLPPLGVALCAGALFGSIHTVVYDLIPTAPGDRLWGALSAGARAWLPRTGTVRVSLGLDAVAPLARHRFTVGGQAGSVFRQSAVVASAQLGLGLHF